MSQPNSSIAEVLKKFLQDVYGCGFPPELENKIADEARLQLDQVLLDNLKFYETKEHGGQQLSQGNDQQPSDIYNNQYQQQPPQQYDAYQQQVSPKKYGNAMEQQSQQQRFSHEIPPQSAHGMYEQQPSDEQQKYRGRASYNIMTGEDDMYGGKVRGDSSHGKRIIQDRNKSSIFGDDLNGNNNNQQQQYMSSSSYGNKSNQQSQPIMNQPQRTFEQNYRPPLTASRYNHGNGVTLENMKAENESLYEKLKTRNQRSNIF